MATDKIIPDWRNDSERDIAYWHKTCANRDVLPCSQEKFSDEIRLYLDNEFGGVCWNCRKPLGLSAASHNRFIRYVAAVANNLVMTHGGSLLRIESESQDFKAILAELNNRYCQIFDIFAKWYPNREKYIVPFDGTFQTNSRQNLARYDPGSFPQGPSGNFFLGIDIGNSRTKISVLRGDELVYINQMPSQISEFVPSGPFKYFDMIVEKTNALISNQVLADAKIDAVGISWFGDVSKGIPLAQAADLALWNDSKWEKELHGLNARLESIWGDSTTFYGDSEALATYIGIRRGMPQTYLMIMGTSTGGAYFLTDGSYQPSVNLVSRIVIDLEDDAPRHSSTRTPGTLQQYSASYGIARIFQLHSFVDGQFIFKNTGDGAYLSYLLSHSKPEFVKFAKSCIDRLASWIIPAVVDLQTHYTFNQIVFSGGNVRPPLGPAFVDSFQKQWQQNGRGTLKARLLSDETGWPPLYEIAIATAKLAAKKFVDGVQK